MPKEQIEYVLWGLIYEALADQTNCSIDSLNSIGNRLLEIEKSGAVKGWQILDGEHILGGTD